MNIVLQNVSYIFAASSPPHLHPRLGPGQQGGEVAGLQACKEVQLIHKPWQSSCFKSQIVFSFIRLLLLGASHFPPPVVCSLQAIVQRCGKEKSRDLLWRSSLALLCELSTLNPDLFIDAGGPLFNLKCTVVQAMITMSWQPRWCQSCHLLPTGLLPDAASHWGGGGLPAAPLQLARHQAARRPRPLPRRCTLHGVALRPLRPRQVGGEQDWELSHCLALHSLFLARWANLKVFNKKCVWSGLLHPSHPSLPSRPLASLLDTLYLPSYDTLTTILDLIYKSQKFRWGKFFLGSFQY